VASDYRAEGVPVVFVRDVVSKTFTWKSDVYVDCQKAASLSAHDVVGGDVLLTKMGLPPCIACTYPSDFSAGIVTADIVRLRLNKKIVLSDWGSNYANSEHVAAQVRGITSGVTRPKVTLNDVRSLKISVPPLEDQQAILLRVAEANRRVAAARKSLNKLISEKTGLMDDLLTGRVRVTPLLD
jgi:type I restriction enzyme S subunit